MNSVFDYRDYRDFLKERIALLKKERRGFTYRFIAAELGLNSAGHVSQMINGTTAITPEMLKKFMDIFQIKGKERDYFTLLVQYHQTGPMNEKRELLRKIASKSGKRGVKVSRDQYEFYQKWYYAAIRDILDLQPFTGDYKELAQMVEPAITPQEARKSIQILERLGMIIREDNGAYKATSQIVEADFAQDARVVLSGYAEEMTHRAVHALNRMEPDERSISWASFSTSKDGFQLIRDEIRLFRERIMEIVEQDHDASRVYHMNIHCFPLSKDLNEEQK